jgi:hypothetical protein
LQGLVPVEDGLLEYEGPSNPTNKVLQRVLGRMDVRVHVNPAVVIQRKIACYVASLNRQHAVVMRKEPRGVFLD